MCGIFGFGFIGRPSQETIIALIKAFGEKTKDYGSRASGIAIASPQRVCMLKTDKNMSAFVEDPVTKEFLKRNIVTNSQNQEENITALIGHCRYPTKGSERVNANNHPFQIGNVTGIHAGCLQNDDDLFYTHRDLFNRIGTVDSEIIFQLINHYRKTNGMVKAIKETSKELLGSYTCAVLSQVDPNKLFLFKKNTRIDLRFYEDIGLFVFSSGFGYITDPAMVKVFGARIASNNKEIRIDDYTGIVLDVGDESFSRFNMLESKYKRMEA